MDVSSLADMRTRVEAARVARLATTDPDGRSNLVPICFVVAGDVLYTAVDEKPKRTPRLASSRWPTQVSGVRRHRLASRLTAQIDPQY